VYGRKTVVQPPNPVEFFSKIVVKLIKEDAIGTFFATPLLMIKTVIESKALSKLPMAIGPSDLNINNPYQFYIILYFNNFIKF